MVGVLIRTRLAVLRHSLSGQRLLVMGTGAVVGLALAAGTVGVGVVDLPSPEISTDVLAATFLIWTLGWALLPVITGSGDDLLRPEHYRLVPVPVAQLARGLLLAGLVGVPPVITLIGFTALIVQGARSGPVAVVVGVAGTLLQFVVVILLSRVVTAALGSLLASRRGRDVGMMVLVVFVCTAWMLRFPLESLMPRLLTGQAPGFSQVVRWLPSGWASVAVEAAGRAEWLTALAPLAGLAVLAAALTVLWTALLRHRMSGAPGGAGGSGRRRSEPGRRWLPATPTGAVVGKEVRTWFRDVVRNVSLLGVVIACVFVALAPAVLGTSEILPFGGVIAVLIAALLATNLYGLDGRSLWITLVSPDAERADVRGRQWAWLLIIGAPSVVLTVLPTLLSGTTELFPWVLAALPALLGGGAGLVVLLSVYAPYPMPDQRMANPLAFRSRLSAGAAVGAVAGLVLLAVATLPALAVVLLGTAADRTVVQWLGLPVGIATGVLLFRWWGALARRRLQARGPELFALLRQAA